MLDLVVGEWSSINHSRQAVIKLLHHHLELLAQKGLDKFIPGWRRQNDPVCDPDSRAPLLRFVADEEGLQNRALHFLFSFAGLRGAITPEICHPKWNCWKRSKKHAGLEYDILRLMIAANYSHGTKLTGERQSKMRGYLKSFLAKQSDEYFQDLADEIMTDRRRESSGLTAADARDLVEEYLDCPSIRRKGEFVKNKSWFGILNVLALMVKDWSILREASHAILQESAGSAEVGPAGRDQPFKKNELYKAYKNKAEADRSLGSSMGTVIAIAHKQSSLDLCIEMRVAMRCRPPVDITDVQEDVLLTEKASKFAMELAGSFAWSEQFCQMTFPLAAAALLSDDVQKRTRGMTHLKKLVMAINKAEALLATRPDLQGLLDTLAFQEETLARELMVHLERGGFQLNHEETQKCQQVMREFCSGTSSTKEILESTFGHLSYVSNASNKNKRMSTMGTWFYAAPSPYVDSSGMTQCLPTERDWLKACSDYGVASKESAALFWKAFRSEATKLPRAEGVNIPVTAKGVQKTQWRLSGPASHYNRSAAAAYLLFDAPTGFVNCSFAWAGVFLMRGEIFLEPESDEFYLSLGFQGWAALGIKLDVHLIGDKDS
ncbi:unnamed protein product [Durusdinium trenchii]|uniref:Uncharacterized protein n=2 Tax=Durusdinium trenchii TaxID=1381693 RepID=A0ABP0JMC8_9DINO